MLILKYLKEKEDEDEEEGEDYSGIVSRDTWRYVILSARGQLRSTATVENNFSGRHWPHFAMTNISQTLF